MRGRAVTSPAPRRSAQPTPRSWPTSIRLAWKFNAKMYIRHTPRRFPKSFDPDMKGDYQDISQRIGNFTAFGRLETDGEPSHQLHPRRAHQRQRHRERSTPRRFDRQLLGKLNSGDLISGFAKMGGDMSSRVVCLSCTQVVLRPQEEPVLDKVTGISDFALYAASPVTMNKPVLVTDSSASARRSALGSTAYTEYYTPGRSKAAWSSPSPELESAWSFSRSPAAKTSCSICRAKARAP